MQVRKASAEWKGNLPDGTGTLSTESGVLTRAGYSFVSRFESGSGTNPEELIGAALAGCFSMAFANELDGAGHPPVRIETDAMVRLEKTDEGHGVTKIELQCRAEVPGIDDETFQEIGRGAKKACPMARALAAVEISLEATLVS